MRVELSASFTTFYASPYGNDANDGSLANPWRTIQHAWTWILQNVDCRAYSPLLQLADGDYPEDVAIASHLVGSHFRCTQGNLSTPSAVTVRSFFASDYGCVVLKGLSLCGITAAQFGIIDFSNCEFRVTSGVHVKAQDYGSINCTGPYSIVGGAVAHLQASGGQISLGGQPVSIPSALAFPAGFALASDCGKISANGQLVTYSGSGAGSASSGQQYLANVNGIIEKAGTTFPGNAAGGASCGGQVIG